MLRPLCTVVPMTLAALSCGEQSAPNEAGLVAPRITALSVSPAAFAVSESTMVALRVAFRDPNADLSMVYVEVTTDIPQVTAPPRRALDVKRFFVGQDEGVVPIDLNVELPRVGAYNVSVLLLDQSGLQSAPATQTLEAK